MLVELFIYQLVAEDVCYIFALSRFNGKLRQLPTPSPPHPANVNSRLKTLISNKVDKLFSIHENNGYGFISPSNLNVIFV